ncbi:hypothetical protein TYRP_011248 [Tyrophagus putrescentiae]|nr:hypothetical protein TYRP_011248 [Tyrophagus putrescentiae]
MGILKMPVFISGFSSIFALISFATALIFFTLHWDSLGRRIRRRRKRKRMEVVVMKLNWRTDGRRRRGGGRGDATAVTVTVTATAVAGALLKGEYLQVGGNGLDVQHLNEEADEQQGEE